MARTMQDLSEGVFINMASVTLTCQDSYMDYLNAGILTSLRNSQMYMSFLFPDNILAKVKEEIGHHGQKCSANTSQKKPECFHPYTLSGKQAPEADRKSVILAWKQLKSRGQCTRGQCKASKYQQ